MGAFGILRTLRAWLGALALPALVACGPSPPPVAAPAVPAPPHCQSYSPSQVLQLDLMAQLNWIDEEIATCRKDPAATAEDYKLRGTISVELPGRGPELAIDDFTDALTLMPDDAQAYLGRARAKIALGRYADALPDLNKAIELAPDAAAYANRAGAYQAMGDPEAAIADMTRSIELAPERAKSYESRGLLYGRIGEVDEAMADIAKAIDLDPSRALAWQAALQKLGYYAGPQNGQFDSATKSALRRWLVDRMPGLTKTDSSN